MLEKGLHAFFDFISKMRTQTSDSKVQKALQRLCRNNGWSYGVFWRFHQRNSLLLTMEDAYYEEHMGVIIDNMLLQVHMLSNGSNGGACHWRGCSTHIVSPVFSVNCWPSSCH